MAVTFLPEEGDELKKIEVSLEVYGLLREKAEAKGLTVSDYVTSLVALARKEALYRNRRN